MNDSKNPVMAAILAGALVAVVMGAGCSTLQKAVPEEREITSQKDNRISELNFDSWPQDEQYFRTRKMGTANIPRLEQYLENVADGLITTGKVPDIPIRVKLIADFGYRAEMTPSGTMGVPVGFLLEARNEDTIAFLLGHEIGHVLATHYDRDWITRTQRRTATMLGLTHGIGASFEEASGSSSEVSGDVARAARHNQTGIILAEDLIMPAFSRREELQADRLGVDLMMAAGYNPAGFTSALEIFGRIERRQEESLDESMEDLQGELKTSIASADDARQAQQGMMDAIRRFIHDAVNWARDELSEEYPEPDERRKLLSEYFSKHYDTPGLEIEPLKTRQLDKVMSSRPVKSVLAKYRLALKARMRFRDGDIRQAIDDARQAISGVGSDHALPRIVFADIRRSQREYELEQLNYEYALEAEKPALLPYIRLAGTYERKRDWQGARRVLKEALLEFDEVPHVVPHMARVHEKLGNDLKARQIVTECRLEYPLFDKVCEAGGGAGSTVSRVW